jgi:hypothetical protein
MEHRAIFHGFSPNFQTKRIDQVICLNFSGDLLVIFVDRLLVIMLNTLSRLIAA